MFSHERTVEGIIEHLVRPLVKEGFAVSTSICVDEVNDPILPGGLTSTFNQIRLLLKNVSTLDLLNVQGILKNSSASQFARVIAQFYRVEECMELALQYEKEHNMVF
jgi:hypothetical protein